MRNEKGITLVELLAALAIVGIITAVIASVLVTGTSSADRTSSKQSMQHEANYIVETIRAEYLKDTNTKILIVATKNSITLKRAGEAEKVLSERFEYNLISSSEIDPSQNVEFFLNIEDENQKFEIKTTFSKLR